MKEILTSLFVGGLVGFIFGILHLPVPAPATWAGVAGIVGLFVGYITSKILIR